MAEPSVRAELVGGAPDERQQPLHLLVPSERDEIWWHLFFESIHHPPYKPGQAKTAANQQRPARHLVEASTHLPHWVVPEYVVGAAALEGHQETVLRGRAHLTVMNVRLVKERPSLPTFHARRNDGDQVHTADLSRDKAADVFEARSAK